MPDEIVDGGETIYIKSFTTACQLKMTFYNLVSELIIGSDRMSLKIFMIIFVQELGNILGLYNVYVHCVSINICEQEVARLCALLKKIISRQKIQTIIYRCSAFHI